MENLQAYRDVAPGRRDPYRLQFGEEDAGEKIKRRRFRRFEPPDRKKYRFRRRYLHEIFQPNFYADPQEEEYYGDEEYEKEWEKEVETYLRGKGNSLRQIIKGRRLRRINKVKVFESPRKKLFRQRNVIPVYDNEYPEESYNPNDYIEQRYRPGFEGGSGYPKLGNYGHYGESAPEFERGFQGPESQSPYASGYQVGPSYEGEHGYGSIEDLGGRRGSD